MKTNEERTNISIRPGTKFSIGKKRIMAKKPVEVSVVEDEGFFIASSKALHIYAVDDSITDALRDFVEQVAHFYFHYKTMPKEKVCGLAAKLKRLYTERFEEVKA